VIIPIVPTIIKKNSINCQPIKFGLAGV